jgi:carbamoyl-phosphate synthase/aspartate carbamoyltransferase
VIQVNADSSSVAKGESLPDTVRTLGCYADAIVMRHPDVGSSQLAAKFSPVPILNAGDGVGEHPTQVSRRSIYLPSYVSPSTQALLDVYTIRSELGTVNGRTITLLGDLKNGRTVHSLVTLLCIYSVRLNFVSPRSLSMPSNVVAAARKAGAFVQQFESLEEVLEETDVLYVTRVQKERFDSDIEWQKVKDAYRVDHAVLARAKEEMIVMHPLPRLNGERAMLFIYFNGMFTDACLLRNRPRSRLRLSKGSLFPPNALWTLRTYLTVVCDACTHLQCCRFAWLCSPA